MTVIDDDTSPPVACAKEGCCRPFSCCCAEDEEGCHVDRMPAIAPKPRSELEMPERG